MKLSSAQQEELEVWEYFIPTNCRWLPKTDKDIQMFFEWSEQGKHKDIKFQIGKENNYFLALQEGKKWAGIHWKMYEDGILAGDTCYFEILGGFDSTVHRKWWQIWKPKITFKHNPTPRAVVNQMKREMFKGIDANQIENCYQNILKEL